MKRKMTMAVLACFAALTFAACGGGGGGTSGGATGGNPDPGGGGGGGGGGTPPPPSPTKATGKIFLFGTMSSGGRVATLQTSMTIPTGVLVNYSSLPGAKGSFPLRKGVITPSGPVKVAAADFSQSLYDTESRRLTITLMNSGRVSLAGSITGSGTEIATLNLTLPGTTAFQIGGAATIPSDDAPGNVYQDRLPAGFGGLTGFSCKFSMTYE